MKAKLTALLALVFAVCITGSVMTYNFVKADEPASDGKKTITVAQYDFADANALGKDKSANGNDLTAVGTPVKDDVIGGVKFDGSSALYAAGGADGYDFADALYTENFKLSLQFYVSSVVPEGHNMEARNCIFTVWGYQYNGTNDYNVGGLANERSSALSFDSYSNGATEVNLRYLVAGDGDYNPYWEGQEKRVSTDAWHTATFEYDPDTKEIKVSVDDTTWTKKARTANNFVNKVARFTLGGSYVESHGIYYANATTRNSFIGNIKDVLIEKYELVGNKYNALATYDFSDAANPGKANDSAFDLEKKGDGEITYDAEKGAMRLAKNAVLTAKKDADGYDFMDYMADGKLTVSAKFMIPKTYEGADAPADARNVLFSLWGLWWDGSSYNGGDADKMSSSVIYDAYTSGAETVNLRFGFLYQDGEGTQNGWWSNKETAITTDEFHTITFAIDGSKITVVLDGAAKWSYDIAASHVYKSTNMNFTLGGAYGNLGVTGCNGPVYFKSFSIYDFAMSEAEMIKLQNEKLEVVSAGYIAKANEVASTVTVEYGANDNEIIEAAPVVSTVTVIDNEGNESTASVKWTKVVARGSEKYLEGTIFGAKISNFTGVKAYMAVRFSEPAASAPALVSYDFKDAENAGKSSLGGMFDLEAKGNGTATVTDGVVELDGKALTAKLDANGKDFMDRLGDFTLETSFRMPVGIVQDHTMLLTLSGVRFGAADEFLDTAMIMINNYGVNSATSCLRVGFAYESNEDGDGHGSPYWSKYNKEIQLGVWNNLVVAYSEDSHTVSVYLNGAEVCTYEMEAGNNFKNADYGFTLNGQAKGGTASPSGKMAFRDLKIYNYAASAEAAIALSKTRSMPENADAELDAIESFTATTVEVETTDLTAEYALEYAQKNVANIRVSTTDSDRAKATVVWNEAVMNADGTATVKGTFVSDRNPEGLEASVVIKEKERFAKISFTGENATVKVDGEIVTSTQVKEGANLVFTVEAAEGYEIVSVKAGETALESATGEYKIENATGEITVVIAVQAKQPVDSGDSGNSGNTQSSDDGCIGSFGGSAIAFVLALAAIVAIRKIKERKNA